MFGSQRVRGTALVLRKKGGFDAEKCVGQVNKAVTKNWTKVMRRPRRHSLDCFITTGEKGRLYRCWAPF